MPSLPAYKGPSITGRPVTITPFQDNDGLPWVNVQALMSGGGAYASQTTLSGATLNSHVGDIVLMKFDVPAGQLNALILAWDYVFKQLHCYKSDNSSWVGANWGVSIKPVDASGTMRGSEENTSHFVPAGPVNYRWADDYTPTGGRPTDDGTKFLFNGSTGINSKCLRFNDFSGMALWSYYANIGTTTVDATQEMQGFELTTWYVPVPIGSLVVTCTLTTVVEVNAATAGVALDAAWGNEFTFTNISNARVHDSSRATVAFTDAFGQTTFASIPISSSDLASFANGSMNEVRVLWEAALDAGGVTPAGYVAVGEMLLCKSDGTVLIQASNRVMYDGLNWAMFPGAASIALIERTVETVMDISSLTTAQVNDLATNGAIVRIRWRTLSGVTFYLNSLGVIFAGGQMNRPRNLITRPYFIQGLVEEAIEEDTLVVLPAHR